MELASKKIQLFQNHILDWYEQNKRDLPWRKTRDPYKILISEVMLQQTQVSRVIPKYETWLKVFPDIYSLAKASTAEVLKYWSGLGYNRRALYLQRLAKKLIENKEVRESSKELVWPQTERELIQLPGIGKYTARALLCFSFDQQVSVVDTNVKKVILTQFVFCHSDKTTRTRPLREESPLVLELGLSDKAKNIPDKEIEAFAEKLLPVGKAYEWNQALMDYSSMMLKEHKIVVPRQSKFKDSDRYYRGAIIRFLIKDRQLSFEKIYKLFEKEKKMIERTRLKKILEKLKKDALLIKKKKRYCLPE